MAEPESNDKRGASPQEIVARIQHERDQLEARLAGIKFRWRVEIIYVVAGAALGLFVTSVMQTPRLSWSFLLPILVMGMFAALTYPVNLWIEKSAIQMRLAIQERYFSGIQKEQLQTTLEEDFFTKLVKINFKYIDQYYLQTQSQADKSFTLTAVVAGISVCIVISGVILMFIGKTEAANVTAGAGILSEFIAAVFFYFYNRTVTKMGQYHQKLVLTQNISLAMKIAEGLPEADRVVAQKELIQCLTQDVNRYLVELPEPK